MKCIVLYMGHGESYHSSPDSRSIEALFLDVNPIPVKQAMRAMGYEVGPCRLPLCDMDPTNAENLYKTLKQYM